MSDRFTAAIERFDAFNSQDPRQEAYEGDQHPQELVYSWRMTRWLDKLAPDAPEALRLAARCQHIGRWSIPREHYPDDRKGYLQWRSTLAEFHAKTAGEILEEVGYDPQTIERVQELVLKKNLKSDPDTQLLEDVICLVFLESYFADFSEKHDEDKVLNILRKTFKKMSDHGRQMAMSLPLPPQVESLVHKALA